MSVASLQLDTFDNLYTLGKKIGEGLHSTVHLCYTKRDPGIPLAVKISREDDDEKKLAHRNEFKITSELKHPNIVSALKHYENDFTGEIFIVMDYVKGTELSEILEAKGRLTESVAKNLIW